MVHLVDVLETSVVSKDSCEANIERECEVDVLDEDSVDAFSELTSVDEVSTSADFGVESVEDLATVNSSCENVCDGHLCQTQYSVEKSQDSLNSPPNMS